MSQRLVWLRGMLTSLPGWLDLLSKLATIGAVVIAGIWTYHLRAISGEDEINPEMAVSTQVFDYTQGQKILAVHVREKNVGKVPIFLAEDALQVKVTRIPERIETRLCEYRQTARHI